MSFAYRSSFVKFARRKTLDGRSVDFDDRKSVTHVTLATSCTKTMGFTPPLIPFSYRKTNLNPDIALIATNSIKLLNR